MAAVVAGVSQNSTSNNAAVTTSSFSPSAGDLLVVFVVVSGQGLGGTFSDTQALGWDVIAMALKNGNSDSLVLAVARNFAAASAMQVTFTPAGSPTSSGVNISVLRVSGMSRKGSQAIRAVGIQENAAAGGTPSVNFGFIGATTPLTANALVGAVANATNPAGMTAPTNWIERHDVGYNTPPTGLETASRDSGQTTQNTQWGSSSASAFCAMTAELDISAPPAKTLAALGVG